MIHILIADNNIKELNDLKQLINTYNSDWKVICTHDLDSASRVMNEKNINLFLINTNLSNASATRDDGFDLGLQIRNLPSYKYVPIIYISDKKDKIYDAVNIIHCYSYITTPYDQKQIFDTLDSISSILNIDQPIKFQDTNGVFFYLKPSNIMYATASGKKITLHTLDSNYTAIGLTLTHLSDILPYYLTQCHRQYIVNLSCIKCYDKTNCFVTITDFHIPVGRKYKNSFEELLFNEKTS